MPEAPAQPLAGMEQAPWPSLLAIPAILILVSLPLAFGLVPLNRWYGYRTPRSMSSPAEWRRLNRIAGMAVIAAALVSPGVKLLLLAALPPLPNPAFIHLVDPLLLLLVIAAVAAFTER
ncbi:MAG: SdpI family protein [Bryobacteraceae bacterium]|nr:SdpI family protein [Bryobacteraceae bacterium]